jgi:hypothetical protein
MFATIRASDAHFACLDGGMDLNDDRQFAAWLDQVLSENWGLLSRLAKHMGVDKGRITHWRQGKLVNGLSSARRERIIDFVRTYTSAPGISSPSKPIGGVKVMGKIGHWNKASDLDSKDEYITSPITKYPASDQMVFKVINSSRDGTYRDGDYIFAVKRDASDNKIASGTKVIIERSLGNLVGYGVRQVRGAGKGMSLVTVIEPPEVVGEANTDEKIIAVVIGKFTPEDH